MPGKGLCKKIPQAYVNLRDFSRPPWAAGRLFTVYALYFKDYGSCAVVAAGDHHAVVLCPAMHDAAALQCGINVAADSVPSL